MSHENNHEMTRIALREEVERSLESVLPTVPEKKKREAATRVEQLFERYSSPYPDPQTLARIEELAPGSTEKIIAATLQDLEHRRTMDLREADQKEREMNFVKEIATVEVNSVRQGRWLGFFAYIACLTFAVVMYRSGSENLAYAAFGTAAIGIIAQLIRGGSSGISISGSDEEDDSSTSKTGETMGKRPPAKRS